jgi:hypothetical protein
MMKKLVIFAFMAIFVSYCPQCWGSGAIYKKYVNLYILERDDKKLIIFAFYGHFS